MKKIIKLGMMGAVLPGVVIMTAACSLTKGTTKEDGEKFIADLMSNEELTGDLLNLKEVLKNNPQVNYEIDSENRSHVNVTIYSSPATNFLTDGRMVEVGHGDHTHLQYQTYEQTPLRDDEEIIIPNSIQFKLVPVNGKMELEKPLEKKFFKVSKDFIIQAYEYILSASATVIALTDAELKGLTIEEIIDHTTVTHAIDSKWNKNIIHSMFHAFRKNKKLLSRVYIDENVETEDLWKENFLKDRTQVSPSSKTLYSDIMHTLKNDNFEQSRLRYIDMEINPELLEWWADVRGHGHAISYNNSPILLATADQGVDSDFIKYYDSESGFRSGFKIPKAEWVGEYALPVKDEETVKTKMRYYYHITSNEVADDLSYKVVDGKVDEVDYNIRALAAWKKRRFSIVWFDDEVSMYKQMTDTFYKVIGMTADDLRREAGPGVDTNELILDDPNEQGGTLDGLPGIQLEKMLLEI